MDETTNNNQTNAPASSEVNGENNEDSSLLAKDTIPENDTTANGIHNNDDIIEVTEEDENDAPPPRLEDDNDDDSAVEILDAVAFREQQQATAAAAASTALDEGEDSDEELRCVGTANETKLPHNRQDCLEFRYNNSNNNTNLDAVLLQLFFLKQHWKMQSSVNYAIAMSVTNPPLNVLIGILVERALFTKMGMEVHPKTKSNPQQTTKKKEQRILLYGNTKITAMPLIRERQKTCGKT